jgi:DNA-binding MurR/RpiR family transcriptional regulator
LHYHCCNQAVFMSLMLKRAVAECLHTLTEADERLVRTLLAHPTEAAFLSAAELSQRSCVHLASAVRLAQKLGFAGYPELRASLQAELVSASEPADRVRKRLSQMEDNILGALVASEVAALLELPRHVDQNQLEEAARSLIGAERVYLFGRGHATALVDLMDRRLRRSGFATMPLPFEGRDLAEHVLALRETDTVLAFAFHRTPSGLTPLLAHAKAVGANSVLVSDLLGPLLRPQPDVVLAAPRGTEAEFQTLSVPMALLNALILTIARLDDNRSLKALDSLSDLLERFTEDQHDPSETQGG